jgi:PRTRC genetic system protein C
MGGRRYQMALRIVNTKRVFIIKRKSEDDNIKLDDPNPNMSEHEVQRFYSSQYPELTSATVVGPSMKDGNAVYSFETIIGDKG